MFSGDLIKLHLQVVVKNTHVRINSNLML